jgi:hypothetical protein
MLSIFLCKAQEENSYDFPLVIRDNKIKMINEWAIYCDSSGRARDSVLENKYFFNDSGQITEKRFDFSKDSGIFFTDENGLSADYKNRTNYSWIKYYYDASGHFLKKQEHIKPVVYNAEWIDKKPYTICSRYENGHLVEFTKYYTNEPNNIIAKTTYKYNEMGFLYLTREYDHDKLYRTKVVEFIKKE